MKKNAFTLIVLYVLLFVFSCTDDNGGFDDCNCSGDINAIEFTALTIEPFELPINSLGQRPEQIQDSVAVDDFFIRMYLDYRVVGVTAKSYGSFLGFGFTPAFACSCVFLASVENQISSISVLQKPDAESDFTAITQSMGVENFFDSSQAFLTLQEAIEITNEEPYNGFIGQYRLRIVNAEAINDQAIFKIVITLEDGNSFEQEIGLINFHQS